MITNEPTWLHLPLDPKHPRLRFIEGAPDGGGEGGGEQTQAGADGQQQTAAGGEGEQQHAGVDALGDPGKKALDAMKAERNSAREAQRKAEQELAALKAAADGKQAEHDAEVAAQKVRDDALAAANQRIAKSEIKLAAAGKLADPSDALLYINASDIEVSDDGSIDSAALASAIDELVKQKPYLAAQGSRFEGSGDGGQRSTASVEPKQVTEAELKTMSRDEINKARKEGRLKKVLGQI